MKPYTFNIKELMKAKEEYDLEKKKKYEQIVKEELSKLDKTLEESKQSCIEKVKNYYQRKGTFDFTLCKSSFPRHESEHVNNHIKERLNEEKKYIEYEEKTEYEHIGYGEYTRKDIYDIKFKDSFQKVFNMKELKNAKEDYVIEKKKRYEPIVKEELSKLDIVLDTANQVCIEKVKSNYIKKGTFDYSLCQFTYPVHAKKHVNSYIKKRLDSYSKYVVYDAKKRYYNDSDYKINFKSCYQRS